MIGVRGVKFDDIVYIYKKFFNESLINDRIRTFNTKIRKLIYTENKYERVINIEKVIDLIKSYIGVSLVEKKLFAEVMTDFFIVDEMLDLLDQNDFKNPDLTWFGPTAGIGNFQIKIVQRLMDGLKEWQPDNELRYKHIMENMIYVCELQTKNMFLYLMLFDPNNEYKMNYYRGSFLDEGFDNHMKNVWKIDHFDRCIENPPFNQMIDMDILQKTYLICDQIIFVHPSTWLLDEKNKQKKFIKTKDLISKDLQEIILFNGNKIFNIALFVPCVITNINKNKKTTGIKCLDKINDVKIEYKDIYDINKFSNMDIYPKLKEKILEKSKIDNLDNRKIFNVSTKRNFKRTEKFKHLNTTNEYYVNVAQIRGNVNQKDGNYMIQDDFYTIITKDNVVSRDINNHMFFKFQKEILAKNFLDFLKTNFCRFCLSIYKNNSQLECGEMSMIPWLDFTQEWTEDKLYKFFNLNEEEIKFIEKNIPKYYE